MTGGDISLETNRGADTPDPQPNWVQNQPTFRLADLPVFVFEDPETLGRELATEIVALFEANEGGGQFLLGCPGGRSLQSTYVALAHLAHQQELDLSQLVIVMMDEYLVSGSSGLVHCRSDVHYSCVRFARKSICELINAGLPEANQVPPTNLWAPDAADPEAFDHRIEDSGGVDLFLIASGSSDGHVAFNPPGTALDSSTRVVELADSTRRDNLATFPEFADLEEVPRFGISVGLGTISRLSHRVALVMTTSEKAASARELAGRLEFEPDWPATMIFECNKPVIFVDQAAAEGFDSSVKTVNRKHDDPGRTGQ